MGGNAVEMGSTVAKLIRQSKEHTQAHITNKNKNINNKIDVMHLCVAPLHMSPRQIHK